MTQSPPHLLLALLISCGGPSPATDSGAGAEQVDDGGGSDSADPSDDGGDDGRWAGTAAVRVIDDAGTPIADAWVMQGGASAPDWVATDSSGDATLDVTDDGVTDRYILAGKEGWFSGGANIRENEPPNGTIEITMLPLPTEDNVGYAFQKGGDASSPDTTECGHCHRSIADGWTTSLHRNAARNDHTLDVYLGAATTVDDCDAVGGWMGDGREIGNPDQIAPRCYVGEGVLSLLNDDCGGPDQIACDHPDNAPNLDAFGSCGDCHSPAQVSVLAGQIDLASSTGIALDEGVTCDLCHKIRSVTPDGGAGIDGSIALLRPSQETMVVGQEFDPINFGPYPDVIVALMKGSYAPQFRESAYCAGCHEYRRDALASHLPIDTDRWPDGLPIHETYSEWQAGFYGGTAVTCQSCHMPTLDEESSTYDITDAGLVPSVDQGWSRETGEVRQHAFSGDLTPPSLALSAVDAGDTRVFTAQVTNGSAGHAVPTGEALRQYIVALDATDGSGASVSAVGGQAIPDVGGYLLRGVIDDSVIVDADTIRFSTDAPSQGVAVRFVRPTGTWDDPPGPGTGSFDDLSAEDKGLPINSVIGERTVVGVTDGLITLDATPPTDLQAGDIAYLVAEHHLAGKSGWVYAKVFTDAQGNAGVAHYRATDLQSDNRIAPGASGLSEHVFPTLDGLSVTATLTFRRYAAPVADQYGWDVVDTVVSEDNAR